MSATAEHVPARGAHKRMVNQCAWLFAFALFGYPIVGNVISFLQIDSRVLSIPFRITVALFSAWVILTTRRLRIDRLHQVMLLIWFLYIVRLVHDSLVSNLQGADYAMQFFIASSVLPALALMKARAFQNRQFALIGFLIASTGTLLSLLAALFGNTDVREVAETSGRLSFAAIDAVSLGNQAVSAILCGVALWRDANARLRTLIAFTFMGLLWCLALTGSKGPALALLLCVGLWALRRRQVWKLATLALPLLIWLIVSNDNPLATRLAGSEEDQSTADRLVIFNDSVAQIASAPLVGSAFVELNSGYYPHDVFIEAALAFGIPVALVFLGLMLVGTYKAWRTLNSDYDLLGLIFFQGLLAAAVSGSIYGSMLLWVTLAMLPTAASATRDSRRPLPRSDISPSLPARL
jgi:O-antigen ligase